ncbi:uncharacterized protein BYT42DRAFT_493555 [Radiomyces spectabilis]|uniref:uncharacterized protein n=1 Tax=Radiomyces spectabilis TaxID=64574 RepID=UPI00221F4BFD|nr:uncharacterized protein BYT42DRAFT_493555 [Radiomyces spectabilis]KAI8384565.1 hypothetical protein BYT42DRAFT_493555 [Radiomyces spectabilis]
MWSKLTDLFQRHSRYGSRRSSTSTCSTDRRSSAISSDDGQRHRPRRKLVEDCTGMTTIPPYSPTYCKPNEFPYSNFYVKLPNGKWMVRYRSGNRDILGTDEFAGYMI